MLSSGWQALEKEGGKVEYGDSKIEKRNIEHQSMTKKFCVPEEAAPHDTWAAVEETARNNLTKTENN